VRHRLATTLWLPQLLRTDSLPARPPLYNLHIQAVNSANGLVQHILSLMPRKGFHRSSILQRNQG